MASKIYTASASSQRTTVIPTDKVRISTVTAIAYAVGNAAVTANLTSCTIIPGNKERDLFVGQGNYIAFIDASGTTAANFSVTELGAPYL